jgi:hypothetical protein
VPVLTRGNIQSPFGELVGVNVTVCPFRLSCHHARSRCWASDAGRKKQFKADGSLKKLNIIGLQKAYPEFEFTSLRHVVSTAEKFCYLVRKIRENGRTFATSHRPADLTLILEGIVLGGELMLMPRKLIALP